jgi:hypothetical protein
MPDPQEDARRIARILRNGDYDDDGSTQVFKLARQEAGLKPPKKRSGTAPHDAEGNGRLYRSGL